MTIPEIPLPEPVFTVTVSGGSDRECGTMAAALRFLLWATPAGTADYLLAVLGGQWHGLGVTATVTVILLALSVLTVGVEKAEAGGEP